MHKLIVGILVGMLLLIGSSFAMYRTGEYVGDLRSEGTLEAQRHAHRATEDKLALEIRQLEDSVSILRKRVDSINSEYWAAQGKNRALQTMLDTLAPLQKPAVKVMALTTHHGAAGAGLHYAMPGELLPSDHPVYRNPHMSYTQASGVTYVAGLSDTLSKAEAANSTKYLASKLGNGSREFDGATFVFGTTGGFSSAACQLTQFAHTGPKACVGKFSRILVVVIGDEVWTFGAMADTAAALEQKEVKDFFASITAVK